MARQNTGLRLPPRLKKAQSTVVPKKNEARDEKAAQATKETLSTTKDYGRAKMNQQPAALKSSAPVGVDAKGLARLNAQVLRRIESKGKEPVSAGKVETPVKKHSKMEFQPVGDQIFYTSARKDGESPEFKKTASAGAFRTFLRKDSQRSANAPEGVAKTLPVG